MIRLWFVHIHILEKSTEFISLYNNGATTMAHAYSIMYLFESYETHNYVQLMHIYNLTNNSKYFHHVMHERFVIILVEN